MLKFITIALLAAHAFAQVAVYPGAVSTNANLGVAKNSVSTYLTAAISATATSFTVADATNIVANQMLTMGTEIVWVCGVSGKTITVGRATCPNVDGRGFDTANGGGPAAVHVSGASSTVKGNVTAWYTNSLAAEVKAIEGTIIAVAISIQQTGAVCDGVTDDGAVINALIAAAPPYSTVVVPSGANCASSIPIVINRDSLTLTTTGWHTGIITPLAANIDTIQIGDGVTTRQSVAVTNLITAAPPSNSTAGYAINVRNAGNVNLDGVYLYGGQKAWRAVNFTSCITCALVNSHVAGYRDKGIVIAGIVSATTSDVRIEHNRPLDTFGSSAISIGDYAGGIYIESNEIYSVLTGYAIDTSSKTGVGDCCIFVRSNDIDTSASNCSAAFGSACDAGALNFKNATIVEATSNSMGGSSTPAAGKVVVRIDTGVSACKISDNRINAIGTNYVGIYALSGCDLSVNKVDGGGASVNLFRLFSGNVFNLTGITAVNTTSSAIQVDAGVTKVVLSGQIDNATTAVTIVDDTTTMVQGAIGGCSDVIPPIASAATITLPGCGELFTISGTTALATMRGQWYGRTVKLQFTNATPGGTTTGGTSPEFPYASSVAQNHALTCTYFGVNWVCQ